MRFLTCSSACRQRPIPRRWLRPAPVNSILPVFACPCPDRSSSANVRTASLTSAVHSAVHTSDCSAWAMRCDTVYSGAHRAVSLTRVALPGISCADFADQASVFARCLVSASEGDRHSMQTTNSESPSAWAGLQQYLARVPWMRLLKILSVVTAAGLFLVQMQGVLVTVSGSAAGCGGDWPLCNGQVVPGSFTLHSLTEFGHRVLVPPVTLCVLGTSFGMLAFWRKRRETLVLVTLMIGFLLLQAALGALAVVYPTSPIILALHYGIALVAFASAA